LKVSDGAEVRPEAANIHRRRGRTGRRPSTVAEERLLRFGHFLNHLHEQNEIVSRLADAALDCCSTGHSGAFARLSSARARCSIHDGN